VTERSREILERAGLRLEARGAVHNAARRVPAALGSLVDETLALVERDEPAVDTTRAGAIWTLPGPRQI
jgi:hypothetical protein